MRFSIIKTPLSCGGERGGGGGANRTCLSGKCVLALRFRGPLPAGMFSANGYVRRHHALGWGRSQYFFTKKEYKIEISVTIIKKYLKFFIFLKSFFSLQKEC
jgi:hypothetical protein